MPALTEDEFLDVVRGFRVSAFRFEAQRRYKLDYERDEYQAFMAGHPRSPDRIDWWRPWFERVRQYAAEGRHISRVRVLDKPPTEYQRWLLWASPWHTEAGEDIRYLPRSRAETAGLPLNHDWWLLDDARLIIMLFTEDGEVESKTLVTDNRTIATYRTWRDLAVAHSTPAAQVAAA